MNLFSNFFQTFNINRGQVVGKIGRTISKLTHGKVTVPKIFALDPTAAHFESNIYKGFETLSRTDADYVQVIHTNAGILGLQSAVGTTDFFPNGGIRQPGCENDPLDENICSHIRSWEIFQSAIIEPFGFPGVKCSSYDDFMTQDNGGNCQTEDTTFLGHAGLPK